MEVKNRISSGKQLSCRINVVVEVGKNYACLKIAFLKCSLKKLKS